MHALLSPALPGRLRPRWIHLPALAALLTAAFGSRRTSNRLYRAPLAAVVLVVLVGTRAMDRLVAVDTGGVAVLSGLRRSPVRRAGALVAILGAFAVLLALALAVLLGLILAAQTAGVPTEVVQDLSWPALVLVDAALVIETGYLVRGYRPRRLLRERRGPWLEVGNVAGDHTGRVTELLQRLGDFADSHALVLHLEADTDPLVGFYHRVGGFTSPDPAHPRRIHRIPRTVPAPTAH